MLRLLSPKQVGEAKSLELSRDVLRIKETKEATDKVNKALANAEVDFNNALARNRLQWGEEEQKHLEIIAKMSEEISLLKIEREKALIPIEVDRKKVEDRAKEVEESRLINLKKEEENEQIATLLEEKLSEVGEREVKVLEQEDSLAARKNGLFLQEEQTKIGAQRLSQEIADFNAGRLKEEEAQFNKRKEIEIMEINMNVREKQLEIDVEALKKFEIQLKDERATIDRIVARGYK